MDTTNISRCGINNSGNDCYINSALQCLAVSPFILEFIDKYKTNDAKIIATINKYNIGHLPAAQMGKECEKILQKLKTENETETETVTDGNVDVDTDNEEDIEHLEKIKKNSGDIFVYIAFKEMIKNLNIKRNQTVSNQVFIKMLRETSEGTGFEYLVSGEQNDPHEFLAYLLDRVHNAKSDDVEIKLPPDIDSPTFQHLHRMYLKHVKSRYEHDYSHFVKNFYYYIINCVQCDKCEHQSIEVCPSDIMCVSIPDLDQPQITLEDCLKNMFEVEDISYKCEKCENKEENIMQKKLLSKPKNIIIKIKRYTTMRNMLFKVSKMVHYPEILDLSEYFCGTDMKPYKLYGVINHIGMLNGGHYYAYVRNLLDKDKDESEQWYCCNDTRVNKMPDEAAMGSNNAYMLFYTSNN